MESREPARSRNSKSRANIILCENSYFNHHSSSASSTFYYMVVHALMIPQISNYSCTIFFIDILNCAFKKESCTKVHNRKSLVITHEGQIGLKVSFEER